MPGGSLPKPDSLPTSRPSRSQQVGVPPVPRRPPRCSAEQVAAGPRLTFHTPAPPVPTVQISPESPRLPCRPATNDLWPGRPFVATFLTHLAPKGSQGRRAPERSGGIEPQVDNYNVIIAMTSRWRLVFYTTTAGRCPVRECIDSLSAREAVRLSQALDLLEEVGVELGAPHVRCLGEKLWELRVTGPLQYRVFYFAAAGRRLVLLDGRPPGEDAGMNWREYVAEREARDPEFKAAREEMRPQFEFRRALVQPGSSPGSLNAKWPSGSGSSRLLSLAGRQGRLCLRWTPCFEWPSWPSTSPSPPTHPLSPPLTGWRDAHLERARAGPVMDCRRTADTLCDPGLKRVLA